MQGYKSRAHLPFVGVRQIYKQSLPGSANATKTAQQSITKAGQLIIILNKLVAELERKKDITKKKTADRLADMVKCYKNMREIANHTGWGMEEAEHKQQELNSVARRTVKDHI